MQTQNAAPVARHSAFAAAFFSFLLPGLGQIYAGRWVRGLFFLVPWLLAAALIAGYAFSIGFKQFGEQFADTAWLQYALIAIGIDLVWRLVAVVDAWLLARGPRAAREGGLPRLLSAAGLVVILLVLLVSHAAVARPVFRTYDTLTCITDDECEESGPDDPGSPDETLEPLPTLPPVTEGPTLAPGATATPAPTPTAAPTEPPDSIEGRLNVLLIGTNQGLADTMIVVSIDPDTRQLAFIGMPRDTIGLPIPEDWAAHRAYGGTWPYRANTIYNLARGQSDLFPGRSERARGYNALKGILGETLGIDIPYYVQVDMAGFRDVIDALNGTIADVQLPLYDARYGGAADGLGTMKLYIAPGIHYMSGSESLAYARSRHSTSDFDRSVRQMRVITAIRNQLDIGSILAPGGLDRMLDIIRENVRTDIPPRLLPDMARLAQEVDIEDRISLQLTPSTFSVRCGASTSPQCVRNGQYAYVARVPAIRKAVRDVFKVDRDELERQQTLSSEGATVHVLNGTTKANTRTTELSDYLGSLGIDSTVPPVNAGRADRDDYTDTVITVYNGAREELPVTVDTLETQLGVTAVTTDDPSQAANVVVIVGSETPRLRAP